MTELRIGNWFEIGATDYTQPPNFTWKEFYNFRNHVLRVLRRFGSAGPMGEVDLSVDYLDDDLTFDDGHVRNPDFFVVDDMHNSHDRISAVECDAIHISRGLLETLVDMEWHFQHWYVQFSLGDSGLRVYSDAILVGGRRFWDVTSLEEIADRCSRPIDYGEATIASDAIYKTWVEIIGGKFMPLTSDIDSTERQWVEVLETLRDLAQKSPRSGNSRFAYDAVRHDIHPETRRNLVTRLLDDISTGLIVPTEDTLSNFQRDIGHAFLNSHSEEQSASLAHLGSIAQRALIGKLDAEVVFFWWANILSSTRAANGDLRRLLVSELFRLAAGPPALIQLSGIFGLARLRVGGIDSLIDDAIRANKQWWPNEPLMRWLSQLKTGIAIIQIELHTRSRCRPIWPSKWIAR